MNRAQPSNFFDQIKVPWVVDAINFSKNMMPASVSMSCPPNDTSGVVDERIDPHETRRPPMGRDLDIQPVSSVGAMVVQPSFDDSACRSKTPLGTLKHSQDWQARSPHQDAKEDSPEPRNPSSPGEKTEGTPLSSRHERNLSAHFFDATTLSRDDPLDRDPTFESYTDDKYNERKHRRLYSGDVTNPPQAHRRLNSIGNSTAIQRHGSRRHHREGSAGLDILSAAANVSHEEFTAAAGANAPPSRKSPPMNLQQPHLRMDHGPPHPSHSYPADSRHPRMHPPHPRPSYSQSNAHYGPPQGQPFHPPHGSQFPPFPPSNAPASFYPPGYHSRPMPPHPQQSYPSQYAQRSVPPYQKSFSQYPPEDHNNAGFYKKASSPSRAAWQQANAAANHQGSQTFVTAISVGHGNRTMNPAIASKDDVPSQVGHHRKMSSFSSLGSLPLGSVFSPPVSEGPEPTKAGHHRSTSSTVSFLNGIDVGLESTDDTFLRNLQESNSALAGGSNTPTPPPAASHSPESSSKLATGGTSKRVRRKCTVEGCPNRVVQGGLCISHGAKRKTCKHPGCSKNVKKAGLCSTHGPARKRCEAEGCSKVAVQGGRCIAHGAKKRTCSRPDCTKQAILAGMCKKHHDQAKLEGQTCKEVKKGKPTHTRGLSIFQEMSADTVQSLLTDEDGGNQPRPSAGDRRMW